jgi:hypothetical protein
VETSKVFLQTLNEMVADPRYLIEAGTLLLGLGVAAFGVLQYRAAQRWKVSEFVASEMRLLFDDPGSQVVCKLLDWELANVVVEDICHGGVKISMNVSRDMAIRSLAVDKKRAKAFGATDDQVADFREVLSFPDDLEILRGLFDSLFTRLERCNSYIDRRSRLFNASRLRPYILYHLKIINRDDTFGRAMRGFLEAYEYPGVINLVAKVTGEPWRKIYSGLPQTATCRETWLGKMSALLKFREPARPL